jgi:predicted Zn-dependent protease with MMP-like domain
MADNDEHHDDALEPAWRALEAGDLRAARKLAGHVGDDDPEGLLLLAACSREDDDLDAAVRYLERAIAADDEWPTPELWLGEIFAQNPDRLEEARRHAARALDLADDEGEYLSALALKAGLELELGRAEEAKRTLADLPPGDVPLGDPDAALEIADLHLALGETELARDRLRTLAEAQPSAADVWHALGCAAADLGDEKEMRQAWKRTWSLDAAPGAEGDLPRRLDDGEIEAIAQDALEELPARARELLEGVPVVVAELPAETDVDAGIDPRALGLFSGTAYPEQSNLGGQPGLTQILLFRRNLERVAGDEDELRDEVRATLLHETGHFFGMDDAELEDAGLG